MNKTCFRLAACLLVSIGSFNTILAQVPQKGEPLPAWQKGYLDLHHINTGRGNSAYYVFPDGTTMLFDAGEEDPLEPRTTSARNSAIHPDNSRKPYEWIASYIQQAAPAGRKPVLDYAVISHFHDDHYGSFYNGAPAATNGNYVLTGVPGVDQLVPISLLLDRGYPDYNIPYDMKGKAYEEKLTQNASTKKYWLTTQNYYRFIEARTKQGMQVQQLAAGSRQQVILKYQRSAFPDFYVQNIKSNGKLWSGKDSSTKELFPPTDINNPRSIPTENALSQVLTINYGPFKYYTGGDIPGNVSYGDASWMDVETPVSAVIGQVDVATLDHHGNRDAVNENMVKTFRPRVWIEQVWSSDHPGQEVLIRLTTPFLYAGPRDLFATNMLQPNKDVIGTLIDRSYKSMQGHILVRVLPGGKTYYVIILDDTVKELKVKDVFGPYESAGK
jgi:beta-lactamase superfamily II metal-dependent hydrolase